jgi:hypothetical protein
MPTVLLQSAWALEFTFVECAGPVDGSLGRARHNPGIIAIRERRMPRQDRSTMCLGTKSLYGGRILAEAELSFELWVDYTHPCSGPDVGQNSNLVI